MAGVEQIKLARQIRLVRVARIDKLGLGKVDYKLDLN